MWLLMQALQAASDNVNANLIYGVACFNLGKVSRPDVLGKRHVGAPEESLLFVAIVAER